MGYIGGHDLYIFDDRRRYTDADYMDLQPYKTIKCVHASDICRHLIDVLTHQQPWPIIRKPFTLLKIDSVIQRLSVILKQ